MKLNKIHLAKLYLNTNQAAEYLGWLIKQKVSEAEIIELVNCAALTAFNNLGTDKPLSFTKVAVEELMFHRRSIEATAKEIEKELGVVEGKSYEAKLGLLENKIQVLTKNIGNRENEIKKLNEDKGERYLALTKITEIQEFIFQEIESVKLAAGTAINSLQEELKKKQVEIKSLQQQLEEKQKEQDSLKPAIEANQEPSSGLCFPYSTPELEAMQKAAVKYWATYDPEINTAEPLQKTIGHCIGDTLTLNPQGNGNAARFAEELAKAIRPKKYRLKRY